MPETLSVTFRGVRGSIAVPGPQTRRVGGNTSCVEVGLGEARLLLDGGTGLRAAGLHLLAGTPRGRAPQATVLISHLHWDHVQGFPFFPPLYVRGASLRVIGPCGLAAALRRQSARPAFPVELDAVPASLRIDEVLPGQRLSLGPFDVLIGELRHPGGALGYRVVARGQSVVYACDHEPTASPEEDPLGSLAAGADLLIGDAQYLPAELPQKTGWGHGSWPQLVGIARRAGVRRLVLTHHDPGRTDAAVAALAQEARQVFPGARAAREGMRVQLGPRLARPAARAYAEQP